MMAVIPAVAASWTESLKGKKASEAMTAFLACEPAFLMAISVASTRLIWPAPMPTVAPSLTMMTALDLTCLTMVMANKRSLI